MHPVTIVSESKTRYSAQPCEYSSLRSKATIQGFGLDPNEALYDLERALLGHIELYGRVKTQQLLIDEYGEGNFYFPSSQIYNLFIDEFLDIV